jgi:hypothetical protein
MEWKAEDEAIARRYLLGDLPEDERQHVEEKLMTDGEFFTQVEMIGEELIEDYVRDALTRQERERLEQNFLGTLEGREQVRLSTALRARAPGESANRLPITDEPVPQPFPAMPYPPSRISVLTYSLAAMLLIMICACLWLASKSYQLKREVEQLQAERSAPSKDDSQIEKELLQLRELNESLRAELKREEERRAALEKETSTLRAQARQADSNTAQANETVAMITLTPGTPRDMGGRKTLLLGPHTTRVRLSLIVPMEPYKNYRAVLLKEREAIESREIETAQSTGARKSVELNLPADRFTHGVYIVNLTGTKPDGDTENIGKYYFKVEKK